VIRALDDLSSGKRINLPTSVDLVVGDIRERSSVRAALGGRLLRMKASISLVSRLDTL
jgi:hypothetical protein